jgi:hypothetical protein
LVVKNFPIETVFGEAIIIFCVIAESNNYIYKEAEVEK